MFECSHLHLNLKSYGPKIENWWEVGTEVQKLNQKKNK